MRGVRHRSRVFNRGEGCYGGRCRGVGPGRGKTEVRAQGEGATAKKKQKVCACVPGECGEGGRTPLARPERGWDARRRDPRVNGADLYVVRVSKVGVGAAKPCWRCVRWCAWSGVKRIFHWDPGLGRFEVLKVNGTEGEGVYETSSDVRLFAGAVREHSGSIRFSGWFADGFVSRIDVFVLASRCVS